MPLPSCQVCAHAHAKLQHGINEKGVWYLNRTMAFMYVEDHTTWYWRELLSLRDVMIPTTYRYHCVNVLCFVI
jgi:hypothetical protein